MSRKKLVVIDIETVPSLAYTFGLYVSNQRINPQMLKEHGRMIMWKAQVIGSDKIYGTDEVESTYKAMVKSLWELLDGCDTIIGYNVAGFDKKIINQAFLEEGLNAPSPYTTIDLLKVVRKHFRFDSNKLDFVCEKLGLGGKLEHPGWKLWEGWLKGEKKSINLMRKYCVQDVRITTALYNKVLPWIDSHTGVIFYDDNTPPTCTNCGSTNLVNNGYRSNLAGVYTRYKCNDCSTNLQGRKKEPNSPSAKVKTERL